MAAAKTQVIPPLSTRAVVHLADIENTVANAHKNVADGAMRAYTIDMDNLNPSGDQADRTWLKFYDIIDNSLVASTSYPKLIIPIDGESDDDVGTWTPAGCETVEMPNGTLFSNGLSVMASEDAGNSCSTAVSDTISAFVGYVGGGSSAQTSGVSATGGEPVSV